MEDTSKHTPATARSQKAKRSHSEVAGLRKEWIDELVKGCKTEADLFGPDGAFTRLKGAVMERLLEAEMNVHLGHAKNAKPLVGESNRRNGHSPKTVHTALGSVTVAVPRDREGRFEPIVIAKHQRRLEGFDAKVLALYARGMTMRDIQAHLRELYGTEVSHELISAARNVPQGTHELAHHANDRDELVVRAVAAARSVPCGDQWIVLHETQRTGTSAPRVDLDA